MPESLRRRAADALRAHGIDLVGELPGIEEAIRTLHFPADEQELVRARTQTCLSRTVGDATCSGDASTKANHGAAITTTPILGNHRCDAS